MKKQNKFHKFWLWWVELRGEDQYMIFFSFGLQGFNYKIVPYQINEGSVHVLILDIFHHICKWLDPIWNRIFLRFKINILSRDFAMLKWKNALYLLFYYYIYQIIWRRSTRFLLLIYHDLVLLLPHPSLDWPMNFKKYKRLDSVEMNHQN